MSLASQQQSEMFELQRALIDRATERHCPDCGGKIDRVEAPEGYVGAPDGKVMEGRGSWPVWRHHALQCPLRVLAIAAGLP